MLTQGEFLSTAEIQRFLATLPLGYQDIALELRDMVITCCPWVSERLLWGGLSYHDSAKGGPVRGAICQIELYADHIRLSFIHGVRLPDPQALLHGERKSKRYLEDHITGRGALGSYSGPHPSRCPARSCHFQSAPLDEVVAI